ncbi:MAG: AP protein [Verrucomicrobia bacterium]|nr:AP protein [Verrucomicrobiota bacterium]
MKLTMAFNSQPLHLGRSNESPRPFGFRISDFGFPGRRLVIPAAPRCLVLAALLLLTGPSLNATSTKTENVFLITVDGLRWQEVFGGAEALLMDNQNGGVADTNRLRQMFGRETPVERRAALLPFFWSVIAQQGQLHGNQNKGSTAVLTNGKKFTYPGFNEIFTGFADDRIDKNEKRNNPNVSVLEWLHRKPAFTNRVAGFANWDVHPYILNAGRSGIPVWTGYEKTPTAKRGSRLELVEKLFRDTTPLWPDMNFDSFYLHAAVEYVTEKRPRLVWIAFSETDEWAHESRYDRYLVAARKMDDYVKTLWLTVQSLRGYRGKTTFILTCDHGRGSGPSEWKNHGANVAGAENIWLAVLGPDTPPLGERTNVAPIGQNQIAATLAALVGEDYHAAVPRSGPPIADLLPVAGRTLKNNPAARPR